MLTVFFQWRLHPGHEVWFRQSWEQVTRLLLDRGSLGSALFAGPEGTLCAIARWPDRATRDAAMRDFDRPELSATMRSAIAETLATIDMDEEINLWRA